MILFGFLSQSSKTKAVAAMPSVAHARTEGADDTSTGRADALFELTDAVLCAGGPVTSLVELTLVAEHRRGYGAKYDALNAGRVEPARLRRALASLPLPRAADGRIVLVVDVSPWLRPDAPASADRLFCHVHGRAKNNAQLIPGWPYSFVAALETGRPGGHARRPDTHRGATGWTTSTTSATAGLTG